MSGESDLPKASQGSKDIPNSPLKCLISFLTQLKNGSDTASSNFPDDMRNLINQSLELASGMMTYPIEVSSGLSKDAKLLVDETNSIDFETLHSEGKTGRKFKKEFASDILQGQILKMLVRMTNAKRILEIGTFTGFAALNMAEALPSDGHLVTMEILPCFVHFARDFFSRTPQASKIEVQEGSAFDLLKEIAKKGESFDFIFIDAEKSDYKDYLQIVLDNNILAPKGTMLFDNTLFRGAAYMSDRSHPFFARNGPILHGFNQMVHDESRVEEVMLPISDGVTIVRRIGE